MKKNEKYMNMAIIEATKAYNKGDIPVGAIIVKDGVVIGKGYNKRNLKKETDQHAEIIAIKKANKIINDWRLCGCDMYTTNEPCPMCAGAIQQARIENIYIGGKTSCYEIHQLSHRILNGKNLNHHVKIHYVHNSEACEQLFEQFFNITRNDCHNVSRETK